MKRLLALAALCSVFGFASEPARPKLNRNQAERLALAALTAQERTLPGVGADSYDDPHSPRFMFFTIVWESGPKDSVVVAIFAIDPYTGDVWSATSSCDEITNPELHALQGTFRHILGLSPSEYKRLKTKGPLCE
jgi:hypothetical protein